MSNAQTKLHAPPGAHPVPLPASDAGSIVCWAVGASWQGDLMIEAHFGAFAGGTQHCQQDFYRGRRPGTIMNRRFAVHDGLIKLIDDFSAWCLGWWQRIELS